MTLRNWLHKFLMASVIAPLACSAAHAAAPQSLDTILRPYLERHGLPALAAAVFKNGVIIASGSVGTRRTGKDLPVTIYDRFHIGSDSKAFTSLLAGQLVQAGKLGWRSTPADVFPELRSNMNAEFGRITLEQCFPMPAG